MDRLESYRDLCKEIELWEIRLWDLQAERDLLVKRMMQTPPSKLCANYDGMPRGGTDVLDMPKAWKEAVEIDEKIAEAKDVLSLKREAKRRMECVLEQFDSLEYKVAYLRDVERKPLYEIAKELGYSYAWIRKRSMKIKRLRVSS